MNNQLTTNHQPLTTSQQRLACELTGVPPKDLLKVRATDDSLIVIIHTGQKFIYNLAAIQTAVERLAAGLGRFTDDYFQPRPADEPLPPLPEAALPASNALSPAAPAKTKPRARKNKPKHPPTSREPA